jgi:hypothetical protein
MASERSSAGSSAAPRRPASARAPALVVDQRPGGVALDGGQRGQQRGVQRQLPAVALG